jgi:UDP-N-acetylmuramoylalanine--D-glutamate ligase
LAALAGEPITYVLGEHRMEDFHADVVVRNPAVPRESPYLEEARRHGVPIEMELTLFFARCPGPILGVTGTKGKSTTTALLGEILRQHHPDTVVAGNIRISALEALPQIGPQTPVVLELSSWQLEGLGERGMAPHLAVITNLSPDHLNRYPTWESYVEAKKLIYQAQGPDDLLVLNADDPIVREFRRDASSQVAWFGVGLERHGAGVRTAGGQTLPLGAGAALVEDGQITWLPANRLARPICPRDQFILPGEHNLANALAAAAAAGLWGIPTPAIAAGIAAFRGLPDRMEVVRVLDSVIYINDTTSTAPAATIAALHALTPPIVLLAGGADKALDFAKMAAAAAARTQAILLLEGSATNKLERALRKAGAGPQLRGRYDNLAAAVQHAREIAPPGSTVLLSPGCASFGMFRHEFDRGERFREIVRALPEGGSP